MRVQMEAPDQVELSHGSVKYYNFSLGLWVWGYHNTHALLIIKECSRGGVYRFNILLNKFHQCNTGYLHFRCLGRSIRKCCIWSLEREHRSHKDIEAWSIFRWSKTWHSTLFCTWCQNRIHSFLMSEAEQAHGTAEQFLRVHMRPQINLT